MRAEVFHPESSLPTQADQFCPHEQLQQYIATLTKTPEFVSLLEQYDYQEKPINRTIILQGVYRASLAIDLMASMTSEEKKEKLLRQIDASQITDPMLQQVILGITKIASHRESNPGVKERNQLMDAWSQVSVLREAMQIDIENRHSFSDSEFSSELDEEEQSQKKAFGSGYELVIKQYERMLLTGLKKDVLLFNRNT